jgi:hypothetical protein
MLSLKKVLLALKYSSIWVPMDHVSGFVHSCTLVNLCALFWRWWGRRIVFCVYSIFRYVIHTCFAWKMSWSDTGFMSCGRICKYYPSLKVSLLHPSAEMRHFLPETSWPLCGINLYLKMVFIVLPIFWRQWKEAYEISLLSVPRPPTPMLGICSAHMFPQQQLCTTVEERLDALCLVRSVLYQFLPRTSCSFSFRLYVYLLFQYLYSILSHYLVQDISFTGLVCLNMLQQLCY